MGIDIEQLIQRSARLDISGIDFEMFSRQPLDPASLRCLRYMHDVEAHTMCYLRDVLVTRAHSDPDISAFFACWCYEEHWHGEAIAQVLAAHGEPSGRARTAGMRTRLPRRDQLRPMVFLAGSAVSRHMVTAHMAWGAINEWSTQAGYSRLIAKAGHPVLTELLTRIMKQEGRHIDFYARQARERLDGRPAAQHIVRAALDRFWAPVGSSVMPQDEVDHLILYLFGDDEGREVTRRIDRQISRLPGLDGLQLVERAAARVSQPTGGMARKPKRRARQGQLAGAAGLGF